MQGWFALRKPRSTTNLISNRPHKAETRYPQRSYVGYTATGGWVTVYVPRLRAPGSPLSSQPEGNGLADSLPTSRDKRDLTFKHARTPLSKSTCDRVGSRSSLLGEVPADNSAPHR